MQQTHPPTPHTNKACNNYNTHGQGMQQTHQPTTHTGKAYQRAPGRCQRTRCLLHVGDHCARKRRLQHVAHENSDLVLNAWQHCRRVQHLCSRHKRPLVMQYIVFPSAPLNSTTIHTTHCAARFMYVRVMSVFFFFQNWTSQISALCIYCVFALKSFIMAIVPSNDDRTLTQCLMMTERSFRLDVRNNHSSYPLTTIPRRWHRPRRQSKPVRWLRRMSMRARRTPTGRTVDRPCRPRSPERTTQCSYSFPSHTIRVAQLLSEPYTLLNGARNSPWACHKPSESPIIHVVGPKIPWDMPKQS